MSIAYTTLLGRVVVRADWGVTRARVLAFLADHQWSTQKEIGVQNTQLQRMMRKGLIVRRVSERKNCPYEYALYGVQPDERNRGASKR